MLSVSAIGSAGEAGKYYAQDNYYSSEQSAEANSEWYGKGADAYGLEGQVKADSFERVLEGELPDGTMRQAGTHGQNRPGMDLTFSAPKSVSLLALVGGDDKVREAHVAAVKATLAFAEKHLAETRLRGADGKLRTEQTGKLLVALFHHDSSRRLDPQLHTHAVIANLTERDDGKWVSLKNDQIWQLNTTLGAIYNGQLRQGLENLGYETVPVGKHGSFEVAGFTREQIMAFSQRRAEIVDVLDQLGASGLKAGQTVALKTRPPKKEAELSAKQNHWSDRLAAAGLDLGKIIGDAATRAQTRGGLIGQFGAQIKDIAFNARQFAEKIYQSFGGAEKPDTETFRPTRTWTLTPAQITAGEATGAAIRHLTEREAVFKGGDILKSALEFAPRADPEKILEAMQSLVRDKRLLAIAGKDEGLGQAYTTREAWQLERQVIGETINGIGASQPILDGNAALAALDGKSLNPAQLRAAQLILTSPDRIVGVQGVAGAGKSFMLAALVDVAKAEGRQVIGLAHMNKVVGDLTAGANIPGMTINRFLRLHGGLARDGIDPDRLDMARAMFKGTVLVVDEAGTLKTGQMRDFLALANHLQVDRVALIGDTRQLGAIEQGKPFANQQERGLPTALLDINIRQQQAPELAAASQFARDGKIDKAIATLAPYIKETGRDGVVAVLDTYKSMTPEQRANTLVLPQTRVARHALNDGIQSILKSEGALGNDSRQLTILESINATVEERRHIGLYQPGDVLTFVRSLSKASISSGTVATIASIDQQKNTMSLQTTSGERVTFNPNAIAPNSKSDSLLVQRPALLTVHSGDKIRWTGNDIERGLANSDTARIIAVAPDKLTVETSTRQRVELGNADKMLGQLDLAYAQTIHSAQGSTAANVLGLMEARNATLSSQANFYVVISRMRENLTLFVDDTQRLSDQLKRLTGEKTSALDALDPGKEWRVKLGENKALEFKRDKDLNPDRLKDQDAKVEPMKIESKTPEVKVTDPKTIERTRNEPQLTDAGREVSRSPTKDFGL
jgi:conjugative relaxase-like TrwC/TraI family protein